jgi:hypothetical protein
MHYSRASVKATTPRLSRAGIGCRVTLTEDERARALAFWAKVGAVERGDGEYVVALAWQRTVALAFPDP